MHTVAGGDKLLRPTFEFVFELMDGWMDGLIDWIGFDVQ